MSLYTNCLGHWRLNEGTGTSAADSSGVGNTGTLSQASWYEDPTYGWVFHANNTANSAVTHSINCGNVSLAGAGTQFTIAARFYRTATVTNGYICGKYISADRGPYLWNAGSSTRFNTASTAGASEFIQDDSIWGGDAWHHIICSYDNGDFLLWKNGASETPNSAAFTHTTQYVASAENFTIGNHAGTVGTGPFVGYISDVAMWSRLLTTQEISDVYNNVWTNPGQITTQPLYYGTTLLANKTNIEWAMRAGHDNLTGTLLGSGTAGTTNSTGNFVPDGTNSYGAPGDPVTLEMYWEEGSAPVVDRSLIVKTTLASS